MSITNKYPRLQKFQGKKTKFKNLFMVILICDLFSSMNFFHIIGLDFTFICSSEVENRVREKKSELSCQKNGVEISYKISIFFSLAKKKMIINAEHDTVETHLQSDHPEFELFFWVHYLSMRHTGTPESDAKIK